MLTILSFAAPSFRGPPRAALARSTSVMASAAIEKWSSRTDNSLLRDLRPEPADQPAHRSREVVGAHYTRLRPTVSAPEPELVIYSADVAASLGLTPADCATSDFLRMFAGAPPAEVECWATVYGASFAGQYGGQRGDGRAISLGIVNGLEVQSKGAGTTPYSRQFDGRAVLRSCVREFLACEAMHALRVPTTRALCVVRSGESIGRMWYTDDGRERPNYEPGAVGTRVAPSFLRFGQFEIFSQRGEWDLLKELAVHALHREFPHVLVQRPNEPLAAQLAAMFAEVCDKHATLVAEWLRVGYAQVRAGSLDSDGPRPTALNPIPEPNPNPSLRRGTSTRTTRPSAA